MSTVVWKITIFTILFFLKQGEVGDQGDIGKIGETVSLFFNLTFVFESSVTIFRNYVSHSHISHNKNNSYPLQT